MIELKNVSKSYGKMAVLTDISFTINPGEFVCITGASGAGKSTLLHLITGAEEVTKGSIEVDGVNLNDVPPSALQIFRRRLGIVFQDYKLLKNRTVAENIAFPLQVCGIADTEIEKRTTAVLTLVDVLKAKDRLVTAISGGEKARTAIGRAVVHDPMIILADEPTGSIDPSQAAKILNLFRQIHSSGTTVILATHDTALVDTLQTRVIELQDGKVVRDSIGGYKGELPPSAKHDILDIKEKKESEESKEAGESGESGDKKKKDDDDDDKKRKVKVTSVST